ncbi:hypothetical protein PACTADRAFT_24372, partial [Pachysolen tannophilus NRRL Y-2460]
PTRLPPSYRNWITKAANMDTELVEALRLMHSNQLFYGKPSENEKVLEPLCLRINIDPATGNPAKTFPIPCKVVHSGLTDSCEINSLIKFWKGFKFAFKIYAPLNSIIMLISAVNTKNKIMFRSIFIKNLISSLRSSIFLATFIALNWYPICLFRNKIGPFLSKYKLLSSTVNNNFDKSLAPSFGSFICGLSSLIETSKRRKDLTLFMAPKALLTIIPLEAKESYLRIESFAFSVFFAILVCYAKEHPKKIRGMYGKGLSALLKL